MPWKLSRFDASVVLVCALGAAAQAQAPEPLQAEPSALEALDDEPQPEPGGLTAAEVQSRAVATSGSLATRRAELSAAVARIAKTRALFFPQLTLRARYARLSPVESSLTGGALVGALNAGPIGVAACPGASQLSCAVDSKGVPLAAEPSRMVLPQNSYSVGAALVVPLSDYVLRMTEALAAASSDREASRYFERAEALRVRSDARVLYLEWQRAQGQVGVARAAVKRASARRDEARGAFELGALSRADLLKLEALVANAGLAQQQALSAAGIAATQLGIAMGDRPGQRYVAGEAVPRLDAPIVEIPDTRAWLAQALERRLEVKALEAATRSLAHGRTLARAARLPRLDAVADLTYANPNERYFPPTERWNASWSAGVVASWNLSELFSTGARLDELDALQASTQAQQRSLQSGIEAEIAAAQLTLNDAHAALEAGQVALQSAQEGLRATADQFHAGHTTAALLVDAESELSNARITLLNARVDLAIGMERLDHALGRDVAAQEAQRARR